MLLKPGVRSMKGALLSTVLSLWQSSHLAKSQIHISQIITTYNVIPLQQSIVKLNVSHYIIYMSLRHKQTYCVESALPNRKLAVRAINHEPIVQKLPLGPFVLCHPDQNLIRRDTKIYTCTCRTDKISDKCMVSLAR